MTEPAERLMAIYLLMMSYCKIYDNGFPHSLHLPSGPITPMQLPSLHKTLLSHSSSEAKSSDETGFVFFITTGSAVSLS